MNKLTVVTYLHQNESRFERCVIGMNRQTLSNLEWLILTHKPIEVEITCLHQVVILPAHIILKSDVLNFILPQITTPYIAYNDSDDKSFPTRFEQQVAFMEANPHIDICSAMFVVNETENTWPLNERHEMIVAYLLINSPMANPSVILKNRPNFWGQVVKYNSQYVRAQDYGFWLSCLKHNLNFYNLQTPLISYFVSDGPKTDDTQEDYAIEIRKDIHRYAQLTIPDNLQQVFNDFCKLRYMDKSELDELFAFLNKQKYKHPFKQARDAFAWHLKLHLITHSLTQDQYLNNWVEKFEKKPWLEKLLG
jgi:hypothetical protein